MKFWPLLHRSGRAPKGTALASSCVLAALLMGCTQSPGAAPRETASSTVTVLAAASTSNAIDEIARQFQRTTNIRVRISAGPSNALAAQILAGAPADIFLSANAQWASALEAQGLAAETRRWLTNDLALVVPRGNPTHATRPTELLTAGVKKVALAGEEVPAGIYAQQALTSLGLYDKLVVANKIVRGHDVRVTLTYVERAEVEAGVVYETDALVSDQVETVYTFSPSTHDPIEYPAVLLAGARENAAAKTFFNYLDSSEAEQIFVKHGFQKIAPQE